MIHVKQTGKERPLQMWCPSRLAPSTVPSHLFDEDQFPLPTAKCLPSLPPPVKSRCLPLLDPGADKSPPEGSPRLVEIVRRYFAAIGLSEFSLDQLWRGMAASERGDDGGAKLGRRSWYVGIILDRSCLTSLEARFRLVTFLGILIGRPGSPLEGVVETELPASVCGDIGGFDGRSGDATFD